jgi:hypothetical protein
MFFQTPHTAGLPGPCSCSGMAGAEEAVGWMGGDTSLMRAAGGCLKFSCDIILGSIRNEISPAMWKAVNA